jgi:hypothetical protein
MEAPQSLTKPIWSVTKPLIKPEPALESFQSGFFRSEKRELPDFYMVSSRVCTHDVIPALPQGGSALPQGGLAPPQGGSALCRRPLPREKTACFRGVGYYSYTEPPYDLR